MNIFYKLVTKIFIPINRFYKRQLLDYSLKKRRIYIRNSIIHGDDFSKLLLGENIYLGDAFLDIHDKITIENNVGFGHQVKILTGSHDWRQIGVNRVKVITKPVHIKTGAWVASYSIILPGTVIGENSVIAAGSVVSGNIEPFTLVGGNPARFIKHILPSNTPYL